MDNDLIFGTETSDMLSGTGAADTQLAAAPEATAPFDDALTRPFDAAQVVVPQGENVVREPVTPGEIVELPFPADSQFLARIDNGNLAIKVGDVTVILQGYVEAAGQTPPVIEAANGQPLDIATILASTDPNIDIQTAAGPAAGPQGQGADNTGAFLTQFGEGAGLGGFDGAGAQDGTDGLGGGTVDQTGTLFKLFGLAVAVPNEAPLALDDAATTNEDTKITGQVTATDPENDPLTYSAVGGLPAGVTFGADGKWSFDPAGLYDDLQVGKDGQISFQYKANDGTSDSNVATVTIDITGVNDAPKWAGGFAGTSFSEDTPNHTQSLASWVITDPDDAPALSTIAVVNSTLPDGVTYDAATKTIHFDTKGKYDYLNAGEAADFTISFTITDPHGGTSVKDVTVHIAGAADAVDAVNDVVLTNVGVNASFTMPEWAVLANDKDRSTEDVTSVSNFAGGTASHVDGAGTDGTITFTDNATLGGSFKYHETDLSTATVTVKNQAGGDITGTTAHEIIVSGAAGDKIDGKGGKDLIFGGDGDDTVIFHTRDVVQGQGDSIANSNALATSATRGDVLATDHDVNFINTDLTHFGGVETISTLNADTGAAGAQSLTVGAATVTGISDHTITPGGLFAEHLAVRIDGDAVDQLYLSISKDGAGTGIDVNGYSVYAHETTAGDATTADSYVMVANTVPTANVHLNQDQPVV
jgi:hypothetical protein